MQILVHVANDRAKISGTNARTENNNHLNLGQLCKWNFQYHIEVLGRLGTVSEIFNIKLLLEEFSVLNWSIWGG